MQNNLSHDGQSIASRQDSPPTLPAGHKYPFSGAACFEEALRGHAAMWATRPVLEVADRYVQLHGILTQAFAHTQAGIEGWKENLIREEIRADFSIAANEEFASSISNPALIKILAETKVLIDTLSAGLDEVLDRMVQESPEKIRALVCNVLPPSRGFLSSAANRISRKFIEISEGEVLVRQFESAFDLSKASSGQRAMLTGQLLHLERGASS